MQEIDVVLTFVNGRVEFSQKIIGTLKSIIIIPDPENIVNEFIAKTDKGLEILYLKTITEMKEFVPMVNGVNSLGQELISTVERTMNDDVSMTALGIDGTKVRIIMRWQE